MGVLDKLARFVIGGQKAVLHEATDGLRQCYVDCVHRARQLARHAEMAPNAYASEGLQELTAAEQRQAERLRQALSAAGETAPAIADAPLPAHALNYWARLVQDLEAQRQSARRLRELAVHFAENLPSTAALFDELSVEESDHCERLRVLIARADPQALD